MLPCPALISEINITLSSYSGFPQLSGGLCGNVSAGQSDHSGEEITWFFSFLRGRWQAAQIKPLSPQQLPEQFFFSSDALSKWQQWLFKSSNPDSSLSSDWRTSVLSCHHMKSRGGSNHQKPQNCHPCLCTCDSQSQWITPTCGVCLFLFFSKKFVNFHLWMSSLIKIIDSSASHLTSNSKSWQQHMVEELMNLGNCFHTNAETEVLILLHKENPSCCQH